MEVSHHLLGRDVACSCQRVHRVPISRIAVDADMMNSLVQFLSERGFRNVLVVADVNTYKAFGQRVEEDLSKAPFSLHTHVFTKEHGLLADEVAVAAVSNQLDEHPSDVVLAVGSGVINDIVRYVTFERGLPYVSVATAPSMDGYASTMAAMQFNGIKVTSTTHSPIAIFAHPNVLSEAPWELLQSGFGDLIGKIISLLDWKLAHTIYAEYLCQAAYDVVSEPLNFVISHAQDIRARDQDAVKNLFIGLVNSGIAMAMMGNSRPASGAEHHCSHYWDLAAYHGRRAHYPHGLQVGYATASMIELYRYIKELPRIKEPQVQPVSDDFVRYASQFYGPGAKEVIAAQTEKYEWLTRMSFHDEITMQKLRDALEPELSRLDEVQAALITMDITGNLRRIEVDDALRMETFLHARELRSRYTAFDFLVGQGLLESASSHVAMMELGK